MAALAMTPCLHVPQDLPRPHLHIRSEQIAATMQAMGLQQGHPLICFAPGAEFGHAKRWPVAHFAELANTILRTHPQAQIVLLGSPKDVEVCQQIQSICQEVHVLAGKTTLDQALALIAQSSAMVSNDSGLLHIASALNRPVIAIYGPTDPDHAPPFSDIAHSLSLRLTCAPCKQRECPLGHQDCMQKLDSEQVWKPLQHILATTHVVTDHA